MIRELWLLFISFLKVGAFGYGGGPSMIPLVQQEVVEIHGWMNETDFIDALAMGNTLPGPIAVKMAVYIGNRVSGILGAAVALIGIILPAVVLMALISLIYLRFKDHPKVEAALRGARPAVIGLLMWTAYDLGKSVLFREDTQGWSAIVASWDRLLFTAVAFTAVTFLRVHPALVILGAAVVGFLAY